MRVRTPACPKCQSQVTVNVNRGLFEAWQCGFGYAQDMGLSRDLTERFISGICSPCWNEIFAEEEGGR